MSYLEWEREREEKTEKETEQIIGSHKSLVLEYIHQHGYKGFSLGIGKIHLMRSFHTCILDPENDVPQKILLFVNPVKEVNEGLVPSPTPEEALDIESNDSETTIKMIEENQKQTIIKADRNGNILSIK